MRQTSGFSWTPTIILCFVSCHVCEVSHRTSLDGFWLAVQGSLILSFTVDSHSSYNRLFLIYIYIIDDYIWKFLAVDSREVCWGLVGWRVLTEKVLAVDEKMAEPSTVSCNEEKWGSRTHTRTHARARKWSFTCTLFKYMPLSFWTPNSRSEQVVQLSVKR